MKKSTIFTVLILMLVFTYSSVFAAQQRSSDPYAAWDGVYFSYGFGASTTTFDDVGVTGQGSYEEGFGIKQTDVLNRKLADQKVSQMSSRFAVGYGFQHSIFYAGAQLFLNISPSLTKQIAAEESKTTGIDFDYNYKVKTTLQTGMVSYGFQFEQGILLTHQLLFYVDAGFMLQPWSMQTDTDMLIQDNPIFGPSTQREHTSHASKSFLQQSMLYGAGFRWHLTPTMAIDLSYQFANGMDDNQTIADYYNNLQQIGPIHVDDDSMSTSAAATLASQQSAFLSLDIAF